MLPKENRLKKKKDFEKVFKKGKAFKEDFLVLKIIKNNLKISRFGFVVSKNFSKKTVLRNTIKRRLRETVRTKLNRIKKGIDGVIMVSPNLKTKTGPGKTLEPEKDFWKIEKTVNKLFKKAEITE